jgi:hypothetical protein
MNSITHKRLYFLAGLAMLLLGILMARWIAGWGLVTIHVTNAPCGKVIASIARQGHVRIESSLDPTKLISMDVDRVTPVVAIDILAIRSDASWCIAYLLAPTKAALTAALTSLCGRGTMDDWMIHDYPAPPFTGENGQALDPRFLELTIEGADMDLSKLLDEIAQKGGVMTALPKDWTPTVQDLPKPNEVCKVLPSLVRSVHGNMAEFFFLTERQRQGSAEAGQKNNGGDQTAQFSAMNSEWREQHQLAEIKLLPHEEQPAAQKAFNDRKAFFASMKSLSPEERRVKWQEMMNNADFQEQMQNMQLLRQAKQTEQQRINRAVNYINHKTAVLGH